MFTLYFHDKAETELIALPVSMKAKVIKLLAKLEANPLLLREPDTKPLGGGLFEFRTEGCDIARGLWVYQSQKRIFVLRIFIKKTPKTPPGETELAIRRLEEMLNEI
ncbi:type II toxin-antitoxin system RelE/ParE family toxin [Scandinavium sp. V105_16]|uniref:Type II toxin-antitoxin system RelE/ParE family toxin n=2 Tax=Scandinavium lactucae TaxID=3095028 RepID=A0AAJ2S384_9ENTR|nr:MULTISPECIES: type II toxin-antitoxin system RelE/ParE family toxin [unclassified Scandinavium]MDX6020798.1 type II toxin-antitoxin system RelE/ParE family toxin [Scandinavium sp. V105_16]MDX6033184.1 type II toxin-antitoxin system RelE/ParE family toxin [Scandinavium sp. V105_12]